MKHLFIVTCMISLFGSAIAQQAPQDNKPIFSLSLNKKQVENIKTGLKIAANATVALYLIEPPIADTFGLIHHSYKNRFIGSGKAQIKLGFLDIIRHNMKSEQFGGVITASNFFRSALGTYMLWETYKSVKEALPKDKVNEALTWLKDKQTKAKDKASETLKLLKNKLGWKA